MHIIELSSKWMVYFSDIASSLEYTFGFWNSSENFIDLGDINSRLNNHSVTI